MTTATETLDIKVVYSAGGPGRKRRRSTSPLSSRGSAPRSRLSLVLVGMISLTLAGGLYYTAWWKVDKKLYLRLMIHGEFPMDAQAAAGKMFPSNRIGTKTQPTRTREKSAAPAFTVSSQQIALGGSVYGWLTLAVISTCSLALSGGSMLGRRSGSSTRILAWLLVAGTLCGLGWGVWTVQTQFDGSYKPNHLRLAMGGIVLLAAAIGMALGRGVRGWTYLASITTILWAGGSVVALYFAKQHGWLKPDLSPVETTTTFMAIVFIAHSAWGWLLLPMASRASRW